MPPDFLGIGAQKAGTTWLHRQLAEHPGIWMPPEKELHYFDEKADLGGHPWRDRMRGLGTADVRWRRQVKRQTRAWRRDPSFTGLRWNLRYFMRRPGDDWYLSLFDAGKGKVTGEITPNYATLTRPQVRRVHELMPDARIIFMMRNPIERAWSASVMKTRKMSRDEAQAHYQELFASREARDISDYERTLRNWTKFYPPEQVFVGFLEDVGLRPRLLMRMLYGFLGLELPRQMKGLDKVIHGGVASTMPTWVGARLAETYEDLIDDLAIRYGGYASFWQFSARKLRSGEITDEEIPYPFYEIWRDEWLAEHGEPEFRTQSGPLSEIQIVNPRKVRRARARAEAAGKPIPTGPLPRVIPGDPEDLRLPDFLGLGTRNAGAGWLRRALESHPGIFIPEHDRSGWFLNPSKKDLRAPLAEYAAGFEAAPDGAVTGEIGTDYLARTSAQDAIVRHHPDVQMFAVLRNPVERALSQWRKVEKKDGERGLIAAFDADLPGRAPMRSWGNYDTQVAALRSRFPRRQVGIFLYDDLEADPAAFLAALYRLLGVDDSFTAPGLTEWRDEDLSDGDPFSPEERAHLAAYYAPMIDRLEEMLDRDLSAWRS